MSNTSLPQPWLLVFDLDGTLIDSSLDLCLAVNAAMSHVGAPELPHELISGYIGDGAAMLIRRALGDPGDLDSASHGRSQNQALFESAFHFFLAYYREHLLDNTRPYSGVLNALQTLRSAPKPPLMAVLTNKPVVPSRILCDALGLAPFFFANYGGNSFETKKPHPFGLRHIINEAQNHPGSSRDGRGLYPPKSVVMIGDSAVDILTAKRAGTGSLGCLYGLAPQTLVAAQPDLLCHSPDEWPGLLL